MEVGRIIGGKYRLRHELGEGAMGSVWAGVHELLGRSVAIKFMRPALEGAETAAARFVAEAKAAAQLKHRFIVDVFDFGITEDGLYYMVQELLDGESLAQTMNQGPAWPLQDVVSFAVQCLSGLSTVHQNGVVHRDLKPENIFVMRDADGRFPKLLDFGISKAASAVERRTGRDLARPSLRAGRTGRTRHLTALGAAPGTPAYMSPEQLRNQSDLDARADLYSLGVVLYEWLSGRCPYAATSDYAALDQQIRARSMTPLERLRPDLSPALSEVIVRALAPEAKDRYASASEMREALLKTLPSLGSSSSVVQSPAKTSPRWGNKTQVMLESAGDPFADPDEARFLPRFPVARVALAVSCLVALLLALWLPSREPEAAGPRQAQSAHPEPSVPFRAQEGAARSATQTVEPARPPLANDLPEKELPLGADMPAEGWSLGADTAEEDLPVQIPEGLAERRSDDPSSGARAGVQQRRAPSAHAPAERARHATQPPGSERPSAPLQQEVAPASGPSADRPLRQKVVRQLDF